MSPNFNSNRIEDPHVNQLLKADVAFSLNIVIYHLLFSGKMSSHLQSVMSCKCFSGTTCQTIPNPKRGSAFSFGFLLQLRCDSGYFFNPYPAGLPALFENPSYRCLNNKWVSQNDGVSILYKAPDCMSKSFALIPLFYTKSVRTLEEMKDNRTLFITEKITPS